MIKKTIRPQITAYECMLLIFSELVKKGRTLLRQDTLVSALYEYRNDDNTKVLNPAYLLRGISLQEKRVGLVSAQLVTGHQLLRN